MGVGDEDNLHSSMMEGGFEVTAIIIIIAFYGEPAYAGHGRSVISKVEFKPVIVSVAFETNQTGELSLGEIVFERGENVEIESYWHVSG